MEKKDKIDLYCDGQGHGFKNKCPYYESNTRECRLLKEKSFKDFFKAWDKNCDPIVMVKKRIKGHLRSTKTDIMDIDDLTSEAIEKIIKNNNSLNKGYNYFFVSSYLKKTAYSIICDLNKKPNKGCGKCLWLSPSKPHYCGRDRLPDGELNLNYSKKRNGRDEKCEGFEPVREVEVYDSEIIDRISEKNDALNVYEESISMLNERIEDAKNRKTREIRKRQYYVFLLWCNDLKNNRRKGERIKFLSVSFDKSEETIKEDLNEIFDNFNSEYRKICKILEDEVDKTENKNKKRIRERQYSVFKKMYRNLNNKKKGKTIASLAKKFRKKEKTIMRDMDAIKELWNQKKTKKEGHYE